MVGEPAVTAEQVPALLQQALALCQGGRMEDAEWLYRRIAAAQPETPDAWNMLAILLYQRDELQEAGAAAERATALRPQIPPYWLTRGNIALAALDLVHAERCYRQALELAPSFAEAHYRLGVVCERALRHRDAQAAYRTALRMAPDVAEIHHRLAETSLALGDPRGALAAYEQAYSRDPHGTLDRRGALDCLERWPFERLPPFWDAEIRRYFAGPHEKAPYARVGVKALKTRPAFRALIEQIGRDRPLGWSEDLREATADELFLTLLREALLPDVEVERLMTRVRRALVLDAEWRERVPLDFLCALAEQCFNNEFVFVVQDDEAEAVAGLKERLQDALRKPDTPLLATARIALTIGAYHRLDSIAAIDALLAQSALPRSVKRVLTRTVIEPRLERSMRAEIPTLATSADVVSQAVRAMYEEHPYPRWFSLDREAPVPLRDWIAREIPGLPALASTNATVRILVAGCGTGRDALGFAMGIAGAEVLAVDLSLSSLAYAKRMAAALGVTNVEFRQGDILALGALDLRFDVVVCVGVLHHMRDPAAGLKVLAGLLAPGGLMRLGLYSERGRRSVAAAREVVAARAMAPNEGDIRAFRQEVMSAGPQSALYPLQFSPDFYSMSMCRDLIFHVQEHQYRLPAIAGMLREANLHLLGLCELPREAVSEYQRMFPGDAQMLDPGRWDALEEKLPETFSRMFVFWAEAD